MASLDIGEESLADEIEDDEPEPNVNHDVQAIQDVQDERKSKIYDIKGKKGKLPQPHKITITDKKVPKLVKKRRPRSLDDHFVSFTLKIQNAVKY